jgi:tRNA (mo5U34)-methyltransferase
MKTNDRAGYGPAKGSNKVVVTQAELDVFSWHHSIDFGGGIISKGNGPIACLQKQADIYFDGTISGKSFLDIGCWDGFNSIEASRRGAARVLATDHFAWSDQCWGDRRAFELARANTDPSIEVKDIDLPGLSPEAVGTFDTVLFAGVFYHLRHPFLALENLTKLAKEWFIVETHLDAIDIAKPAMIFYPTTELANDHTNWWGPNPQCVIAMLKDCGFESDYTIHPLYANRGIFRGKRISA